MDTLSGALNTQEIVLQKINSGELPTLDEANAGVRTAFAAARATHPELSLATLRVLARWFATGAHGSLTTNPPHATMTSQYGGVGTLFELFSADLIDERPGYHDPSRDVYSYVGTPASKTLGRPLAAALNVYFAVLTFGGDDAHQATEEPDFGIE